MRLRKGWKVMDKGDRIFVDVLLSKPLVDVARDGTVYIMIGDLNEMGVAMDCLERI